MVYEDETSSPLGGVNIKSIAEFGEIIYQDEDISSEQGLYSLGGLTPGVYSIYAELEGYGTDYKLIITNVGGSVAYDVSFVIEGDSPILNGEYKEKIPIRELRPGKNVSFLAAISMGSPSQYNVKLCWKNPDGSEERDEILVEW